MLQASVVITLVKFLYSYFIIYINIFIIKFLSFILKPFLFVFQ